MAVRQFKREYTAVRRAEGWGSLDGGYYQALPYCDRTGRNTDIWRIRATSYATFVERVLVPLENPDSVETGGFPSTQTADDRHSGSQSHREARDRGGDQGPAEARRSLRILDLGAGNGWLANRLAERGHRVIAVDLLDDPLDGLGAARHYAAAFSALLAEFD